MTRDDRVNLILFAVAMLSTAVAWIASAYVDGPWWARVGFGIGSIVQGGVMALWLVRLAVADQRRKRHPGA